MGVKIGSNCKFQFDVVLDYSHYWLIEIGNNVTLAPRVHILAHDASTKEHLGYTKVACVKIGNNVFVGAGSIVLPGVAIADNVIIGAGSVVTKDVPEGMIAVGNPARVISSVAEYMAKEKTAMTNSNTFDESYTLRGNINAQKMKAMKAAIEQHGKGFVV